MNSTGDTKRDPTHRAGRARLQGLGFVLPSLLLFAGIFAIPIAYVVAFSFQTDAGLSLDGYRWIFQSSLFGRVFQTSVEIAVLATILSVVLGYILALFLYRLSPRKRALGLVFVLFPFWTSILVKSYSLTVILGRQGLVNSTLGWMLGSNPELPLIFNRLGVLIGMSNHLVPFVVFPVLANLLAQDRNLAKAASIMGANGFTIFRRVTLPLSAPAIVAATLMCLIISFGFFVTPALLGGRGDVMLANLIDLFTRETLNWTVASAVAVLLLTASLALVLALSRVSSETRPV